MHDQDTDTPAWRLVGHRSRGDMPVPGIRTQNGTNWLVRVSAPGGNPTITNLTNLAQAEIELTSDPNVIRVSRDYLDFTDPQDGGGAGSFGNNLPFPNGHGRGRRRLRGRGPPALLEIPADGDYQFGFRSDDGASLQIVGQTWSNLIFAVNANSVISGDTLVHNALTGDSHTRASIRLAAGTLSHTRGVFRARRRGRIWKFTATAC
jgi:hypothetical protein